MNKIIILICMAIIALLLFPLISALKPVDIEYKIRVTYNPSGNCSTSCSNSTIGNTTTETCYETCQGTIKIVGEEENLIAVLKNLNEINGVYQGFKRAELGNESDITGINENLKNCLKWHDELETCMTINSNVSVQLLTMKDDVGYKENYTECFSSKQVMQNNLDTKTSKITELTDDLKQWDSNKFLWLFGGIILGYVGCIGYQNKDKFKSRRDKSVPPRGEY